MKKIYPMPQTHPDATPRPYPTVAIIPALITLVAITAACAVELEPMRAKANSCFRVIEMSTSPHADSSIAQGERCIRPAKQLIMMAQ